MMQDKLNLALLNEVSKKKPLLGTIQDLLEKKADIKAKNEFGWNLLIIICDNNEPDLEVLQFLIDKGADLKAEDQNGNTCMDWAFKRGCPETMKLLLKNGGNASIFKTNSMQSDCLFEENDLQLSLVMLTQNQFPRNSFEEGEPICQFANLLQDNKQPEHLLSLFQQELFGMLSQQEKRDFLTGNCKYFPKLAQEKIITFMLSLKYGPLFLLDNHRRKVPKFLSLEIIAESLGTEALVLSILKMPVNLINQALESTVQKYNLERHENFSLN